MEKCAAVKEEMCVCVCVCSFWVDRGCEEQDGEQTEVTLSGNRSS